MTDDDDFELEVQVAHELLDKRYRREMTGGADWSVAFCWFVGETRDKRVSASGKIEYTGPRREIYIVQDEDYSEGFGVTIRTWDDVEGEWQLTDHNGQDEMYEFPARVASIIAEECLS